MAAHPYSNQPDHSFWSRSIARVDCYDVDPVIAAKFKIDRELRVVTAGSCFAQHIARRLASAGFNFHVTEPAHPLMSSSISSRFGYGVFSARYGNIYTSRQLLQLLQRARHQFKPIDSVWRGADGNYYDAFRPAIQPGGFGSYEEVVAIREQHLASAIRAFAEMDVFVFTLGLTECWASLQDGAVFPSCPGVIAGEFDEKRYGMINLTVQEVIDDVLAFLDEVNRFNPNVRTILTVSPVPLAATALDKHVLTATTYSKSVLRVAAEMIEQARPNSVAYFPSYEIITGNFTRGEYYAEDLRSVVEAGVDHVMRLFFRHYTDLCDAGPRPAAVQSDLLAQMHDLVAVQCEEAMLDVKLGG